MHITGFDEIKFILNQKEEISNEDFCRYKILIEERANSKPTQYIINKCEFMAHDFYVDENVLIPRPDTEILVEACMKYLKPNKKILEIGTGSGCITISLAKRFDCDFTAVDISEKAIEIAKLNADKNNVSDKIKFIKSDILSEINGKFDIIISNPPYIKKSEIDSLEKNVRDYEPHLALDGGNDGLDFYRKISENAKNYLHPSSLIFFEIGHDQALDLHNIFNENKIKLIEDLKDYNGLDRVIIGMV